MFLTLHSVFHCLYHYMELWNWSWLDLEAQLPSNSNSMLQNTVYVSLNSLVQLDLIIDQNLHITIFSKTTLGCLALEMINFFSLYHRTKPSDLYDFKRLRNSIDKVFMTNVIKFIIS